MRRDCNLELCLQTPSLSLQSTNYDNQHDHDHDYHHHSMADWLRNGSSKEKQLTIIYNGRVNICDATELQAKAIIMHASRQIDGKMKCPQETKPSSPVLQSQLHSPTDLSMKRSLQRFLQKRKHRIQATSPYLH